MANKHTKAERAAAIARARGQYEPQPWGGLPSERMNRQQARAAQRATRRTLIQRKVAKEQAGRQA